MACCAPFQSTVDQQFSRERAALELRRYRRKGAGRTARLLVAGIARAGGLEGTLLDVGAGVGGLTFDLLERGVRRATIVDASAGYVAAASEEAARRGVLDRAEVVQGDFLAHADATPAADIVTLDRVVCCYPLYEPLLVESLRHARRVFAFSYPRDRWFVRAGMRLENALRRRRNGFRTFVHPVERMHALIVDAGFELIAQRRTLVWSADVFVRRAT